MNKPEWRQVINQCMTEAEAGLLSLPSIPSLLAAINEGRDEDIITALQSVEAALKTIRDVTRAALIEEGKK